MAGIWAGGVALALAAASGIYWLSRVVASRRLHAAADAYAEREIARIRRHGPSGKRGPSRATAGAASGRPVS